MVMKKELLTKDDIAREMGDIEPLSIRSVERYIKLAGVVAAVKGSGRGKESKYSRDDVEKIKAAYRLAQEQRDEKQSTALTTTKPAMPAVALVEALQASNQALRDALDLWPVWMTRAQAIERTGLPASWLDAGIAKGELSHTGEGRGRRFHRDDVRAFADRIRDRDYLSGLLKKPKAKGAKR